ncbi:MAG: tRNA (adenosine(37)-N6)-dimethylallyltransferase MiaA [bacterium]
MGDSSRPVRVICGPTAAGKTTAAAWFAQRTDVTVISADSRQLYRGFDIGTAKPTRDELRRLPHLGIDVLDPAQRASAVWWAEQADGWIDDVVRGGRTPLVVGGTGLYLRALFGALFEEPELDLSRRTGVQTVLGERSTEDLRRWVLALDPARAHLGRTQLLRAAEVALLTGRRLSDLHRERVRPPRRRARYLVIDPGPVLGDRIAGRTHEMIVAGWLEEVRSLMALVPEDAPAWNASGYRTIRDAVRGVISIADAEQRVVIETRQYAKRQRTWFRHQLAGEDVTRLCTDQTDWAERAAAWWSEGETDE